MAEWIRAAKVNDIPEGTAVVFAPEGKTIALFKSGGQFYAIDNTCPHRGGPLGAGVWEDGLVHCPLHGWAFDLKTGACATNPDKPVKCFPTRVQDGQVQIALKQNVT